MLTPSQTDTHVKPHQIPLFPGSSRVDEIITTPDSGYDRIFRLLNDWVDRYGKVLIRVDETAIIVGEYRIALEDITPKNASQNGIEAFSNVSFSSRWDLLTTEPGSVDTVPPEVWIELIDRIPGAWAERRDNLLELLGNEYFPHEGDFYGAAYGEGFGVYFAYHTSESLWEDDGRYYWQLFIRSLPIPLHGRHGSGFMDEYAAKYEMDQKLRDWGDEYIHFDVFPVSDSILDMFSAPPAVMRKQG